MKLPSGLLAVLILLSTLDFLCAESLPPKVWPSDHSSNICTDTSLCLTFDSVPVLTHSGKIFVVREQDGKETDVVDLAMPDFTDMIGGKIFRLAPITIDGNSLTIRLHGHVLKPSSTYRIIIEPAVFSASGGGKPLTWSFTTRGPIPAGRRELTVSSDGSGDFCTVQGAIDYLPDDNQLPFRIFIRKGRCTGIVYAGQGKNHICFEGEDRKGTIIEGINNNSLNGNRTGRALFGSDANDCSVMNLTVHNTTPYKGSQAEALRINGDRCILRNDDFLSYQDTLQLNGRIYLSHCDIQGDVDFIWGEGTAFFDSCKLEALHDGYYVQSRNPDGKQGYVFLNCSLTLSPGVEKCWLARIEAERFPFSSVAYINCEMGPQVPVQGWDAKGTNTSHLKFEEFHSTDLMGRPLDVTQRVSCSKQLSEDEAVKLSDPKIVLSKFDLWDPLKP